MSNSDPDDDNTSSTPTPRLASIFTTPSSSSWLPEHPAKRQRISKPPLPHSSEAVGHKFEWKGRKYVVVDKHARKSNESWTVDYGLEARVSGIKGTYWVCQLCWDQTEGHNHRFFTNGSTSTNANIVHLRDHHYLGKNGPIEVPPPTVTPNSLLPTVVDQVWRSVAPRVDVNRFKTLLIQWIVLAHIALSCVEHDAFRALISMLNPAVAAFMWATGEGVRNFIIKEYKRRKNEIEFELHRSKSCIHLSFDLWSSPNSLAMCGVVAHWIGPDLKARSVLIGLKRVCGDHSGRNIAETILEVIGEYDIEGMLGYFISDNATNNDTCVEAILSDLLPQTNFKYRRMRCIGHVVNLAAKSFLFGQDPDAFELTVDNLATLKLEERHKRELLEHWRKRGVIGKLHNLIIWIRRTSQRRDAFLILGKTVKYVPGALN
jgi:hypothetical protein